MVLLLMIKDYRIESTSYMEVIYFRTNAAAVSVKIGGVTCAIDTITDTTLTCTTGARSGSINTAVALQVATNGIADQVSS